MLEADQREVLAAVMDRLLPPDERGPGARQLGIPGYVERTLGAGHAKWEPIYRQGLDALDAAAKRLYERPFPALRAADQDAVLHAFDDDLAGVLPETTDGPPGRAFMDLFLEHLHEGWFGDPRHGGNRDGAGWAMIGYPGPRPVVTQEEQALDVPGDDERRSIYENPNFLAPEAP